MHAQLHLLSHWHHMQQERAKREKEAREREEQARRILSRKKLLLRHAMAHYAAKRQSIGALAGHHLKL